MSTLLTITTLFFSLFVGSFNSNTCTYYIDNICLDDSELMEYNPTDTCTAEFYGICIDDYSDTEISEFLNEINY
jgi:hypothetical protein